MRDHIFETEEERGVPERKNDSLTFSEKTFDFFFFFFSKGLELVAKPKVRGEIESEASASAAPFEKLSNRLLR